MFMSASETESETSRPMNVDQEDHPNPRPFAHRRAARVPYCDDPQQGTVIPNRIFVGGIDSTIGQQDLGRFFAVYGTVKEVKIVTNYSGFSRGYGFVSFETKEEVQRLLQNADRVQFRDKVFYIAPAIRKQPHQRRQRSYEGHTRNFPARSYEGHTRSFPERSYEGPTRSFPERSYEGPTRSYSPSTPVPVAPPPVPCPYEPVYLITPDGLPYTYHNGVAYFQMPEEDIQSAHHWPSSSGTHHVYPPVILSPPPQFAPQQPAYHYQYMQQEYLQHSVYLYQDGEQPRASEGQWVHPSVPYHAISEEQTVQVVYQGIHPMPVPRMKARHSRRFSHKPRAPLEYIPEVSEPEEPSEPPVTHAVE